MIAGLSTKEALDVSVAAGTGLAAVAALIGVWFSQANERRRSQPIVIAHETSSRRFARDSENGAAWVVEAYLTSEGDGPAFNVRYGVEFVGVRYPYRLSVEDPESGNVQRVLRAGERRPERGSWPVLLTSLAIWGRAADSIEAGRPDTLDAERVYWARYENSRRQTWETRNPGDRSARLDIRRVRFPKITEWREQRRRDDAGRADVEWERRALAELREIREKAEQAEAAKAPSRSARGPANEPSKS